MALPPLRVRVILRQPDHPDNERLVRQLTDKLGMPPAKAEWGSPREDRDDRLYTLWFWGSIDGDPPDPLAATVEALDSIEPDWRDLFELRATG